MVRDASGNKQRAGRSKSWRSCYARFVFNSGIHDGSKDERPATQNEGAPKRRSATGFSFLLFSASVIGTKKWRAIVTFHYVGRSWRTLTDKQMNEKANAPSTLKDRTPCKKNEWNVKGNDGCFVLHTRTHSVSTVAGLWPGANFGGLTAQCDFMELSKPYFYTKET